MRGRIQKVALALEREKIQHELKNTTFLNCIDISSFGYVVIAYFLCRYTYILDSSHGRLISFFFDLEQQSIATEVSGFGVVRYLDIR